MFLRQSVIRRSGKVYRYWQLVETVRTSQGVRQRLVAHLGDLSKFTSEQWQALASRLGVPELAEKLRRRVDNSSGGGRRGRPPNLLVLEPPDAGSPKLPFRLDGVGWQDPRDFGDVYAALELWKRSGLGELFEEKLSATRHEVPVPLVAAVIAAGRLVAPTSELATARWWKTTALAELLGLSRRAIDEDRMYECLDHVWPLKAAIEEHLQKEGQELFGQRYEVLLYDLSSTYFEGQAAGIPKAKRGYSRDHRPDCRQICFGVAVTPEGWPTGYETFDGNILDQQTLEGLLAKFARRFGPPRAVGAEEEPERIVVMDRGLLTKANVERLRKAHYGYLLAEKRARGAKWYWKRGKEENWKILRRDPDGQPQVEVQEIGRDGPDRLVLVRSAGCKLKERGIHDRVLRRLQEDLEAMKATLERGRLKELEKIHQRLGRLEERHSSLWKWVKVEILQGAEGTSPTLRWEIQADIQEAMRQAEGVYLLRTNLPKRTPEHLWEDYIRLTVVESVFRALKHDLMIRPIHHSKADRVEAHLLFSFLAYVLYWLLEREHRSRGGKLTGRRLLEALRQIKLGTICLKTSGGQQLRLKRVSSPSRELAEILRTLDLRLPKAGAEPTPLSLRRSL
jgi:transposase